MALETLRVRADLSDSQRTEIEGELWALRSGARGEKEAAFHLDFQFGDSKSLAVIHDLRVEHKGRVALIDHLIINRLMDVHVLDSKNFSDEVQISTEGEWETKTLSGWRGLPSPVEQNRRHIEVLHEYIRDSDIAPRRVGFLPLNPEYHNWVLVSPRCQLQKSGGEWENVVKMDMFVRQFEKQFNESSALSDLGSVTRIVATENLLTFANALVAAHRPAHIDYQARFIPSEPAAVSEKAPAPPTNGVPKVASSKACQSCGAPLEPKVVAFCRSYSHRFGKRLLCRTCQTAVVTA